MPAPKISLKRKIDIARRMLRSGKGPRFASLFVTRKCNCRCAYCKSIEQPFADISIDRWKDIIDRLHGWGVRMFSLTGGEPLVRPDIFDIIRHIAVTKKAVCWMISNFKSMNRDTIVNLEASGLQFLTCSLDSLDNAGDKSNRAALDLLCFAKERGIIASTLSVVTRSTIEQVPALAKEVVARGMLFDMGLYQHVGGAFSPADTACKPQSMAQVEKLRRFLRQLKISTGLVSPSWSYLSEDLSLYDSMTWKCSPDRDHFLVVNNDGTLMACQEHPTDCGALDMTDLNDARWRESKRAAVLACKGCFYGCYYQKSAISALDALFDAYSMLRC